MADLTGMLQAAAGAGGEEVPPIDITTAEFNGSPQNWFFNGGQTTFAKGLFFKSDGLEMYTVGADGVVYQYTLGTAWVQSTASYVRSASVASNARDVQFKDDGTKMFVLTSTTNTSTNTTQVVEYALATAWDISTISLTATSSNFGNAVGDIGGFYFKSDGSAFFTGSTLGNNNLQWGLFMQFSLSTPWDITTLSYGTVNYLEAPYDRIAFDPSGDRLYMKSNTTVYQYALSTAFTVSTASFIRSQAIPAGGDANTAGFYFRSDGTRMFVVGRSTDIISQYALSTPWDISTLSFTKNFSVNAQAPSPQGLFFRSDGLRFFVTDITNDSVYQYAVGTAWDVGTASYTTSFSVSAQAANPAAISFKSDGTIMYVSNDSSPDEVNQYALGTAWAVNTASFTSVYAPTATGFTSVRDIWFNTAGTRMILYNTTGDMIYTFTLGTAWNSTTATFSFPSNSKVLGFEGDANSVYIRSDGLKIYTTLALSGRDGRIYEYSLTSAWNVTTMSLTNTYNFSAFLGDAEFIGGMFFKSDGTQFYVGRDSAYSCIYGFTLSTAWNASTSSYFSPSTNFFLTTGRETDPNSVFFKPDGTIMYVLGDTGNDITQYLLNTPWDITTATYTTVYSISGKDTNPEGLFFKPDGLSMYFCGNSSDSVHEYALTVAWDVSTATFVRTKSVSAQEITPSALFFKPDGTKMYVAGIDGDDVNEYNLSTAWNISTATFVQAFSVASQETVPRGLAFTADGLQMFVAGTGSDNVTQYALSSEWDVSTASFVSTFSLSQMFLNPEGIFFKPDNLEMFLVGETLRTSVKNNNVAVVSYQLTAPT